MYHWEFLQNYGNGDANLFEVGIHQCDPGFTPGECMVRKNNIVHFIVSGRGTLRLAGQSYVLEAGQAFFIPAYMPAFYQADGQDPWLYTWIHYSGIKLNEYLMSAHINQRNPVFRCDDPHRYMKRISEMMNLARQRQPFCEPKLFSICFDVFSMILRDNAGRVDGLRFPDYIRENYVGRAVSYMTNCMAEDLSIADVAGRLGLNVNYFSTIFKRVVGRSPQNYLISLRLQRACVLLLDTDSPVKNVALAVGYRNVTSFNKAFMKHFSISPRRYRSYGYGTPGGVVPPNRDDGGEL